MKTLIEVIQFLFYSMLGVLLIVVVLFLAILCSSSAEGQTLNSQIKSTVYREAVKNHLDPDLLFSIIEVESQFDVKAVGKYGEVGLMQLHPRYFPDARADVTSNIATGAKHLGNMKVHCPNQKQMTWITCYNKGSSHPLAQPRKFPYYIKVMKVYWKRQARL